MQLVIFCSLSLTYIVDVCLCCSVWQASHMDTVACCTLERRAAIAITPIWIFKRLAKLYEPRNYFQLLFILLSLHKGSQILPQMTISGTHLHHILRDAFCHRIPLGPSCCSLGHQMVGRKGQVSACPWASAVVHNGSALQHGYSWRSQCTWEHMHAAVSTLGHGRNEPELSK